MTSSIRGGILFSAALTFLALSAGPIDAGLIAFSNDATRIRRSKRTRPTAACCTFSIRVV